MTEVTVKLGATSLMYACQQGKESQVNQIIQTKPDTILERERSLKTALHYCAESGDGGVESAAALLRVAPELVFAQDQDGYTALHLAVIAGNVQLAKLLIAQGADVNTSDNEGHTSTHWATVCGEIECLELILKKKADPNIGDMHGGCPLHYAAQMCGPGSEMPGDRHLGMTALRLLINHFANPNIPDNHGRHPILWAASAGSSEAILMLTNAGANVEAADKDGLTALHCAASRGHTDCVETLVSLCNAEADVIDNNGCSALFYAVTLGHADCTQTLLNQGANTNRQDRKGRTAMHCGAAKGQMETLKVVWSRGGNLWTRTARGDYPLHEAVTSGRTDLVLWLLSLRPDAVNAPNNDGRCPLHLSAIHNNVEMCKVLLDAGSLVNPVMRTAKGMLATPLDAALHKGHRSTAKYLQVHGGVPAARLNSESAALRGPNTRNLGVTSQKPIDNEKEKDGVDQMTSRKVVQASSPNNVPIASQRQKILQVYVEDGVMIRRIKHSQVEEGEEKSKRRRRKRKTKYTTDKSYLRSKEKHGRRGYEESTDEDGYTSQESSIGECKFKTESVSQHNQESIQMKDCSLLQNIEKNADLLSQSVSSMNSDATTLKQSGDTNVSYPQPIKETELMDEVKNEIEILSNSQPIENTNVETANGAQTIHSQETKMEGNDKETENESEDLEAIMNKTSLINEKREVSEISPKEEIDLVTGNNLVAEGSIVEILTENDDLTQKGEHTNIEDYANEISSETIISNDKSYNIESSIHNSFIQLNDSDLITISENNSELVTKECSKQINETENENKDKNDKEKETPAVVEKQNENKYENDKEKETPAVVEMQNESQNAEMDKKDDNEGNSNISPEENTISDIVIDRSLESTNGGEIENYTRNGDKKISKSQKIDIERSKEDISEQDVVDDKDASESDLYDGKHELPTENVIEDMDRLSNEEQEPEKDSYEKTQNIEKQEIEETENQGTIDTDINEIRTEILKEETDLQSKEHNIDLTDNIKQEITERNTTNNKIEEHIAAEDSTAKPSIDEQMKNPNGKNTIDNDTLSEVELDMLSDDLLNNEQKTSNELSPESMDTKQPNLIITKESEEDMSYNSMFVSEKLSNNKSSRKSEKHTDSQNNRAEHGKKDRGLIKVLSDEKLSSSIDREERTKPKRKEWKRQRSSESWEPRSTSPQLEEENVQSENKSSTEPPLLQDASIDLSPRKEKHKKGSRPRSKSRIPRMFNEGDINKGIPISTVSVTQAVQYSVRKYHLERRIFHQLLELKRLQIRAGRSSEGVLVKRLVDDYRRAGLMLGLQQYNGVYTFRAFEKYLYDQLRLLQSSERRIIPRLKSSDDLEKLTAALKKTRAGQDILTSIPSNPALCTYQTHRCHHATHAYTGVPCAAYIKKNHHTMSKPGSFLPKLVNDEGNSELAKTLRFVDPSRPLTLELSHGSEKQVITLPTEKLDKSKRYFVTFTIKTGNQKKAEGIHAHTHASSV